MKLFQYKLLKKGTVVFRSVNVSLRLVTGFHSLLLHPLATLCYVSDICGKMQPRRDVMLGVRDPYPQLLRGLWTLFHATPNLKSTSHLVTGC